MRAAVVVSLSLALASPAAAAPALRTTYVEVDPSRANVLAGPLDQPILYLNRCVGGCILIPGYEDSRTNHSSIIGDTAFIPEFDPGQNAWESIVDCTAAMYGDFGITVTDEDPGDTPHFEAIVAGRPGDAGFAPNIGGVAPFTCGVIDNAITFTFAGQYGDEAPQEICHVIAQESAHAFGLDHELLCEDPMTYTQGCGAKCFQDVDAKCGETIERPCYCGGSRQNSWQSILGLFGPSEQSSDSVRIFAPDDGDAVPLGFHVEVVAGMTCLTDVEVWIDEVYLGAIGAWPFVFDTPLDLPLGPATIRAMATDRDGNTIETSIDVTLETAPDPPDAAPPPAFVDASGPGAVDPEPQPDCGCAATPAGDDGVAGALLLLAAALGLRRRRPS